MHKINTCFPKITFVFVLLMAFARLGCGQGTPVPPSPNASALLEYANVPVNYYNGLPSIDVPLYDLPGRQLSVPVSLSYHASGVRVQDVANEYEFESTWYLSKARFAFNDEATFTYSPGAQIEYHYYSEIIETTGGNELETLTEYSGVDFVDRPIEGIATLKE